MFQTLPIKQIYINNNFQDEISWVRWHAFFPLNKNTERVKNVKIVLNQ